MGKSHPALSGWFISMGKSMKILVILVDFITGGFFTHDGSETCKNGTDRILPPPLNVETFPASSEAPCRNRAFPSLPCWMKTESITYIAWICNDISIHHYLDVFSTTPRYKMDEQ